MPVGFNTPGAASSAADFEEVLGGFWEAKMVPIRDFWYFFGYACGDVSFGRILLDF